ncbi:MAG: DUF5752 family protein [Candidatus Woesearchaeota archaeon]
MPNLSNARPEETFKMTAELEIKNLQELSQVLNSIHQSTFAKHVNSEKNDFANWVRHSLKDDVLAERLQATRDLSTTKELINKRIDELRMQPPSSSDDKKGEKKPIDAKFEEILKAEEQKKWHSEEKVGTETKVEKGGTKDYDDDGFFAFDLDDLDLPPLPPDNSSHSEPNIEKKVSKIDEPKKTSPLNKLEDIKRSTEELKVLLDKKPMPESSSSVEMHPVQHIQQGIHKIISGFLVGLVTGMIIGFGVAYYIFRLE